MKQFIIVSLSLLFFVILIRPGMAQTAPPLIVTLEEADGWDLPGVQSFVLGDQGQTWVIIGGRTDGLHRRQPWATFQPEGNNSQIIVVDSQSKEVWTAGLDDLSPGLQEQLQSTNMEFLTAGETLYVLGGYGYSPTVDEHITYPYLTAVDLPGLIGSVKSGANVATHFRQIQDDRFRVTGGYLGRIGDQFILVGGQDFEGRYNPMGPDHGPGFFQEYTNAIQRFSIVDNGTTLAVQDWQVTVDSLELHRRDYNLVPQLFPDGSYGYTAFSGVFRYDVDLPWLNTVDISSAGYTVVPGFNQYLNQYHTAHAALHDSASQAMHTLFFGGIAQYYLNDQGSLVQDDNVPFVRTISMITRDQDGVMSESIVGMMPDYLGASAEFIPRPDLPTVAEGILEIGAWPEGQPVLIGHILGGIRSTAPNIFFDNEGDLSEASSQVYAVYAQRPVSTAIEVPRVNAEAYFQLKLHPNPASDRLHIRFSTHNREWISLALYNLQGQQMGQYFEGELEAGSHEFEWQMQDLPAGTWFFRIHNGREFRLERTVIK
ncbi:MAG: T9SS type A sorting domain-containing protein [Saprospiraceae bacterium]